MLNEANIPVLVFSAGVGDILEEILLKHDAYFPNIKIVSNYMEFNGEGALIGFKEPIIHTFNKNESVLGKSNYFYDISHRGNAILMGDSDGDSDMAAGMQNPGAILKIGFLNTNVCTYTQFSYFIFDEKLISEMLKFNTNNYVPISSSHLD